MLQHAPTFYSMTLSNIPIQHPRVFEILFLILAQLYPLLSVLCSLPVLWRGPSVLILDDYFLSRPEESVKAEWCEVKSETNARDSLLPATAEMDFVVDTSVFVKAQQSDLTLAACNADSLSSVCSFMYCILMHNCWCCWWLTLLFVLVSQEQQLMEWCWQINTRLLFRHKLTCWLKIKTNEWWGFDYEYNKTTK